MQARKTTSMLWLFLVAFIAVVVRVFFVSIYDIASFKDSEDYILLAQQFVALDLRENNGWRTPLYPILILLLSQSHELIWLVQSLMGVVICVLVFLFVTQGTGSPRMGFVSALIHAIAINQIALEASILAETLSTLLVVAAVYAADRAWRQDWNITLICISALLSVAATLTRPIYISVLPVMLFLILVKAPTSRPRASAAYAAVFLLPLLGWMSVQSATIGSFSITTLLGYNLTTHVSRIVERAPDDFAAIRDTYVDTRKQIASEGGAQTMAIFSAKPAIEMRTGLNAIQLSGELRKMSTTLIFSYPSEYFRSVLKAWFHFYGYIVTMLKEENFISDIAWRYVDTFDWLQRWFFRFLYAVFLLAAIPLVYTGLVRRKGADRMLNTGVLATLVVLVTSVLQALLQFGGNGRFSLPTQPLAVASVVVCFASMRVYCRRRTMG